MLPKLTIVFISLFLGLGSAGLSIAFFNRLQANDSQHLQWNLLASHLLTFILGAISSVLIFHILFYYFA